MAGGIDIRLDALARRERQASEGVTGSASARSTLLSLSQLDEQRRQFDEQNKPIGDEAASGYAQILAQLANPDENGTLLDERALTALLRDRQAVRGGLVATLLDRAYKVGSDRTQDRDREKTKEEDRKRAGLSYKAGLAGEPFDPENMDRSAFGAGEDDRRGRAGADARGASDAGYAALVKAAAGLGIEDPEQFDDAINRGLVDVTKIPRDALSSFRGDLFRKATGRRLKDAADKLEEYRGALLGMRGQEIEMKRAYLEIRKGEVERLMQKEEAARAAGKVDDERQALMGLSAVLARREHENRIGFGPMGNVLLRDPALPAVIDIEQKRIQARLAAMATETGGTPPPAAAPPAAAPPAPAPAPAPAPEPGAGKKWYPVGETVFEKPITEMTPEELTAAMNAAVLNADDVAQAALRAERDRRKAGK